MPIFALHKQISCADVLYAAMPKKLSTCEGVHNEESKFVFAKKKLIVTCNLFMHV